MLECEILTSETEIEKLADEWRRLHARVGRSSYTDYDLFVIWWRVLAKSDGRQSLHVIAGRRDGSLVGVLPLTIARRKGLRILYAAGHKGYYYCDMLAEDADIATALWNAACRSPHYDFADIRDVYPESMCYKALCAFAQRHDITGAFYVRLNWRTGKDWIASLPGNVRGKFKRCTRRLEEKGAVRYEVYETGPLPAAIIDGMVEKKIAWSAVHDKHGLFDYPDVLRFFHLTLETAARQGRLFLAWLRCGDDVIAYNYGLIHHGILHISFWTYDPAWAQYSPGNVIMVHSICRAIDHGLRNVELGQGGSFFKRQYCNETRSCDEFTFSGSRRGRLLEAAFIGLRTVWRFLTRMKLDENYTQSAKPTAGETPDRP